MKKIQFVEETKWNSTSIWYYTTIDSFFVSESGSHDKDIAYEKFIILANGGTLEPVKTILETKTI